MTIVETMVAAVILSAGVLGVFVMVETADRVSQHNRARTNATSVARELLEEARAVPYRTVGTNKWFDETLKAIAGGSGQVTNPSTHTTRTTVTRDKVGYAVEVYTCSFDEVRDSYGNHSGSVEWCADSTATDAVDSQPEDLKRVAVTMRWTGPHGQAETLYQTATFGAGGQLIGPGLTDLKLTSPAVADQQNPVITSNPTSPAGIARFTGTAPGAAEMRFFVDGTEQPASTVTGPSGSSWTFDWNITTLKDGLYQISAVAIDALGARGAPRVMNVRLARNVPAPAANLTGGYNDVWAAGAKTRVVELMWDASAEGSVTGYEVWKGATSVCAASLRTECMDLSPAANGSTTYTVKTLYTDGAGNPGAVSADYTVTAPASGGGGQTFWHASTSTISQTKCMVVSKSMTGSRRDAPSTAPAGTEVLWTNAANGNNNIGCAPPFTTTTTMTASTTGMTVSAWFRNTSSSPCRLGWQVMKNGDLTLGVAGTNYGGGATEVIVPANTTTPTQITAQLGTTAQTFVAGDQLSINVAGFARNVTGNVCTSTTMYFNASARPASTTLPLSGGGGGGAGTITRPAAPTGLTATKDLTDGTVKLTWSPPAGSPPAEFYRIYRDGQDYTQRFETAGDTGLSTIEWVDTDTATTHTYRVTAVSNVLGESDFAGPVTK